MADLFNTSPKKKQLSSRQRDVLRILNEGGRAVPFRQSNPKAARRYSVQDKDGIVIIGSLKRMVIDNLFKMGKVERHEIDGRIEYTQPVSGFTGLLPSDVVDTPVTIEQHLKNKLNIVRQQLNG